MPQTDDHRGGSLSEMQTGLIQKDLIHPLLVISQNFITQF